MKEYFDYPIFIIMLNLKTKAHEVFLLLSALKVHEAVSLIEAHEVF